MVIIGTITNFLQATFVRFPRAVFSGIDTVELSNNEQKMLNKDWSDYLFQSSYSQSYLAWRRRNLFLASVFIAVSVGLQCYDLVQVLGTTLEDCKFTTLGLAGAVSQSIYPLLSFTVLIASAMQWTKYKSSRDMLVSGWLLGMVLLLWPNLVPVDMLLKDRSFEQRAVLGLVNSLATLPMYLAIVGGMTKGARKVHVFSASSLTGAMIVLSAAFSIVIPFAVISLVVQLIGDALIVIGAFLLFLGPLVVLWYSGSYTEISETNIVKTQKVDQAATALRVVGLILILIWAFLSIDRAIQDIESISGLDFDEQVEIKEEITKILDPLALVEKIFQFVGNFMYQSVLWTDIFLYISRNDDAKKKKLADDLLH